MHIDTEHLETSTAVLREQNVYVIKELTHDHPSVLGCCLEDIFVGLFQKTKS